MLAAADVGMRYAIVTETFPPEVNGVALTVAALADGLRARGHVVEVTRPRQPSDGDGDCDDRLLPGMALPLYPGLRFGWPATARLQRDWRHQRPDALYVATEGPLGWSAARAARSLGIPVATGFHTRFDRYLADYGLAPLAPLALAWMRRFHRRAGTTIVPTRELADTLRTQGFGDVARVARAVDASLFNPARRDPRLRARWRAHADAPVVLHVGRISAEKNLPLAIRAFRMLQSLRPDARFVWVGDGPERERLQRENPDFVFCGVQRGESLARHYASADLFVFPSRSETFGNVTLEALASGLPTVAFNYGAAREHMVDGVHGAAPADGDEPAFVAAVLRLGSDLHARAGMARSARDAVANLHPDRVVADFDALFQDLARECRDGHVATA